MRAGRRIEPPDPAGEVRNARRRFDADLAWLPEPTRSLDDPVPLNATLTARLATLRDRLTRRPGNIADVHHPPSQSVVNASLGAAEG